MPTLGPDEARFDLFTLVVINVEVGLALVQVNAKRDLADLCGDGRTRTPCAPKLEFISNPYVAAKDADAVLLMTDWADYPRLDWRRIYGSMRKPALVFDTRNCLDASALRKLGFKVLNIGK